MRGPVDCHLWPAWLKGAGLVLWQRLYSTEALAGRGTAALFAWRTFLKRCPLSLSYTDEEGPTLGRAAAAGGAVVERVAKDLSSLTREQRLAAVQQDAPELLQVGVRVIDPLGV